jgi:hypothetical protein
MVIVQLIIDHNFNDHIKLKEGTKYYIDGYHINPISNDINAILIPIDYKDVYNPIVFCPVYKLKIIEITNTNNYFINNSNKLFKHLKLSNNEEPMESNVLI